jgi:hypothetical protein
MLDCCLNQIDFYTERDAEQEKPRKLLFWIARYLTDTNRVHPDSHGYVSVFCVCVGSGHGKGYLIEQN